MVRAPASLSRPPGGLLTLVSVLLSAHYAIVLPTLTNAMVPFAPDETLSGHGGAFAFRVLPSLLWKGLVFLLRPLHAHYPRLHMPILNRPFASNEDWYVVALSFFSLLAALTMARRLLRTVDSRPGFEWLALGLGYALYFDTILVLNRNLYYPYDVLALFFFTTLTYFAYTNRPLALTLVLVPAMLNKETAIMSVLLFFGLQYRSRPLPRLLATCTAMGAVALGVRFLQRLEIEHICPGCDLALDAHFIENLRQFINPLFWASEVSIFGFSWVALVLFWRYIPLQMRLTAAAIAVLWFAIMLKVGILREVRIFSELSAVMLLLIAAGVHHWLLARPPAPLAPAQPNLPYA